MSKLSESEIERYARHIILPEIGGAGQQLLKRSKVCVIGAGGLGSPVLMYLAAAGVGTLGIVDDDVVSLSNLQRQIIHPTGSIDTGKTQSAAASIANLNPHCQVVEHSVRLDKSNAKSVLQGYDCIVDGSDNFETRYLVADIALQERIPLVTGALGRFDGSVTVLKPFENDNPTYRDLFPDIPPPGTVPTCAEAGILGALAGVIGALQATEAIKLLTGVGEPLIGRLLLYDALSARFETIKYRRSSMG